jgi:hypothetical protein
MASGEGGGAVGVGAAVGQEDETQVLGRQELGKEGA